MTVYVVVSVSMEDARIIGVFASFDSAKEHVEANYPNGEWVAPAKWRLREWYSTNFLEIEDHELRGEVRA
jgi:hypothetical protein